MVFDESTIDFIKSEFPNAHRDPWGNKRIFVDNGPGTLILKRSADAQYRVSLDYSAPYGSAYPESCVVDDIMAKGYSAVADLLNAESPETIVMGQTATILMFQISNAIGRECNGDQNVVTTYYEHLSNISPWRELVTRGCLKEVRLVRLREDGTLDVDHLKSLVDENTIAISVSAASNLLGSKTPLHEVGVIARNAGAYYIVDGVHHMAHGYMDVRDIGCDFLVISAYKCFTPKFSGFMYGRQELLERMTPYVAGKEHHSAARKWQLGSSDHGKLAAVAATIDYFAELGQLVADKYMGEFEEYSGRVRLLKIALHAIEEYERELSREFLTGFTGLRNVEFHGINDIDRLDERDPTFAFSPKKITGQEAARLLVEKYNIAIRSMLYWSMAEDFFDLSYPLRASFVHYNTPDDVTYLINALNEVCG